MTTKLQRAVSAVKAGDLKISFQLLREILAKNPGHEGAWLLMSALVTPDQRQYCLEQVLCLNPQNLPAREALEKLLAFPPVLDLSQSEEPPTPATTPVEHPIPTSPPPTAPTPERPRTEYRTWLYAQRSRIHLTLLGKETLVTAVTQPKQLGQVQVAVTQGTLPDHLAGEKQVIPLSSITKAKQVMSTLRVYYQAEGQEHSTRLELENTATADEVLAVLSEKLGVGFSLSSKPMHKDTALTLSVILTIGSAAVSTFFYWETLAVASGQATATGSIRTRCIIRLLELLGPGGVALIGGVLILIALGINSLLLLKRPTVTELSQRE